MPPFFAFLMVLFKRVLALTLFAISTRTLPSLPSMPNTAVLFLAPRPRSPFLLPPKHAPHQPQFFPLAFCLILPGDTVWMLMQSKAFNAVGYLTSAPLAARLALAPRSNRLARASHSVKSMLAMSNHVPANGL